MVDKDTRKQEIAQKIKNARISAKLTQAQVADKLGITYQAISNYERGKNGIESDLLVKMCDIYNIDPLYVLSDLYTCPVCGFTYDSSYEPDILQHNHRHKLFTNALSHYGICYSLMDCAKIKKNAYEMLESNDSTESEKIAAATDLLKAYFSRSLSANTYSLKHPHFEQYAAMLLNQNRWRSTLSPSIYSSLVDKFGTKTGIPDGETTFLLELSDSIISPIFRDFDTSKKAKNAPLISSEAHNIAVRYQQLDSYGKAAVQAVMSEEETRVKEQAELDPIVTKPKPKIIPFYLTPAAAGYASPAFGSDYEEYALTNEDPKDADFAIRLQGDSMEPYFPDGSTVFCNRAPIADGDIGVFYVDGDIYCKQYHKDRLGVVYLFSLNRKRADADIILSHTSNRGFACFGRIITKKKPPLPQ